MRKFLILAITAFIVAILVYLGARPYTGQLGASLLCAAAVGSTLLILGRRVR